MKFYYYFVKTNKWGRYDGTNIDSLEPEEMPVYLSNDIKEKTSDYIYMTSMDGFIEDIIEVINISGYDFIPENISPKKMRSGQCKYLISGNETVYNFVFKNGKKGVIRLYNLDNIIKMSPDKLSETFGNNKGTLSDIMRACENAINSLNSLCQIKREAPTTITGYAKRVFQRTTGAKNLYNLMGKEINGISADEWIRRSYHGGYNIINPKGRFTNMYEKGVVLDVNSLYPWIMATRPLPTGLPHYVEGAPTKQDIRDANNGYIYLFIKIKVSFKIKENGIPCIRLDNGNPLWYLYQNDYMTTSQQIDYKTGIPTGEYTKIELTLTQSDYKLLFANYDILDIEYIGFVWFSTTTMYFDEYIDRFYRLKKNAKTLGARFCYKMMLNSVSGLMARLPEYENVTIDIKDGYINYNFIKSVGKTSYINVGSAITAYGREYIINKIMKYKDRWVYTDTDSLHLTGWEIPEDIKIGDNMGEFKIEEKFDEVCYYAKKCYGMIINDKLDLTMAGIRLDDTLTVEAIYNKTSREDLVTAYDEFPLTEKDKWAINEAMTGGFDDGIKEMFSDLNERLEANEKKKTEFEWNLSLWKAGTGDFPMTKIYSNGMFSTDMIIEWGDFRDRKKRRFS